MLECMFWVRHLSWLPGLEEGRHHVHRDGEHQGGVVLGGDGGQGLQVAQLTTI